MHRGEKENSQVSKRTQKGFEKYFCNATVALHSLHSFHTIRDGIGRTCPVDILIVFSKTIHKTSGMHGWTLIGPLYVKNLWASFGSNWRSTYGITDLFLPEKSDRSIFYFCNNDST